MPWILIVIFASTGGYNDTRINSGFSQQFSSQASCESAKSLIIQTKKANYVYCVPK